MTRGDDPDDDPIADPDAASPIRVAERLEALGTLAGGLAHDLNNILTVIVTTSALLREELGQEGKAQRNLRTIEEAAARGSMLARRLLVFGRADTSQRASVDLCSVVAGSLELLQRLAGASVHIVPRLSVTEGRILADPVQLEQVLLNLVMNGVDAMPKGGTITIAVGPVRIDEDRARELGLDAGHFVELSVQDTGHGVPPHVRERLFEPFFTTKLETGTGLGLSAVRRIVHEHSGRVVLETPVEGGARFRVWLPAQSDGHSRSSTSQ